MGQHKSVGKGTSIHVHIDTKKQLDELRAYPRETYDDIIKRLIEAWFKQ